MTTHTQDIHIDDDSGSSSRRKLLDELDQIRDETRGNLPNRLLRLAELWRMDAVKMSEFLGVSWLTYTRAVGGYYDQLGLRAKMALYAGIARRFPDEVDVILTDVVRYRDGDGIDDAGNGVGVREDAVKVARQILATSLVDQSHGALAMGAMGAGEDTPADLWRCPICTLTVVVMESERDRRVPHCNGIEAYIETPALIDTDEGAVDEFAGVDEPTLHGFAL